LGLTRQSLQLGHRPLERDPTLPAADWNDARCDQVIAKYREICTVTPTRSVLDLIRTTTVDMWQWEEHEVISVGWFSLGDHRGIRPNTGAISGK